MKASRYNQWIYPSHVSRLLFNGRSAALVEIGADSLVVIQRLLGDPDSATTDAEREYVDQLTFGGFLVPDGLDEIEHLKARNRERRFSAPTFFLTIAPTLACNFACAYCYESTGGRAMDADTESHLLAFAERQIEGAPNMLVTWFGGEPTLCMGAVLRIQSKLNDLAAKRGVKMEPGAIITNGYRLDRTAARQLVACGIVGAQVTLDGPSDVHDRRRPLRSGGGTFKRILENLVDVADILQVVVRVNLDKQNRREAPRLMAELEQRALTGRVRVYFAPVDSADGVCADALGRCFSSPAFAEEQVGLYRGLLDEGRTCLDYPELAPGGHCGADAGNAWVIAPNGLLFKCWEELSLSPEKSVGSIDGSPPTPQQRANIRRYLDWDPFAKTECVRCDILPICMGGCPIEGIKLNSPKSGACSSWKYNLGEMLTLRFLQECRKEVNP